MQKTITIPLVALIGFILGAFALVSFAANYPNPYPTGSNDPVALITATTTTATSTAKAITGADSATFFFTRGDVDGNSGSSIFSVQVSYDSTNWITYNKLIDNVTNTNAQTLTRVSSTTMTGTSTKTYSMDLDGEGYRFMRCVVNEVTDGAHTCNALINF